MNLLLDNLEVIFYDMNLLRAFDTNLDLGLSSSSIRKKIEKVMKEFPPVVGFEPQTSCM